MKTKIKIEDVGIDELKPSEYNPRKADKKQCEDLKDSIKRFGMVDPLIVNGSENRKNIIIGGHFRWRMAKEMGIKKVPVVYVDIEDIKKEKELNLRLNKNTGAWDWDLLANLDEDILRQAGFEEEDLDKFLNSGMEEPPEVEFSEELLLEHNYIILYFDNHFDWEIAQDKFGLKRVKSIAPQKSQKIGVGRVIKGKDVLEKMV